jgi:membrane associated rhomboid family serine protease
MLDDLKARWRHGGAVIRLIFINLAVFVGIWLCYAVLLAVTGGRESAFAALNEWVVRQLATPTELWELLVRPWTLVASMFTQVEPSHLFWNMVLLWFGGRMYQDLLGSKRLVGTYLLSGLAGMALFIIASNTYGPADQTAIGASAAVMGVLMAIATYQPHALVNVILIGPVKLMYVAAVFIVLDFMGMGSGDGVAHEAHIGGAIYGFLASQQLRRGNDWSLGFVNALEKAWSWVKPGRRSKLRVEKHYTRSARADDLTFNQRKKEQQARIDAILDKISRSGYDSLSKEEKDVLFKAGKG